MVKRCNHYDAAFEAYLRHLRVPYVAVDELRRSLCGDSSLKSLDFIVSPSCMQQRWLVDVKGRRFPSGNGKQYWRNWTTSDELRSLGRWETLLGAGFCGLLVFSYHVLGNIAPLPEEELFTYRGELYGFLAMRLDHYLSWSRTLSPKWDTLSIPVARFRELAIPMRHLLQVPNRLERAQA
jgi:hypothetical protein